MAQGHPQVKEKDKQGPFAKEMVSDAERSVLVLLFWWGWAAWRYPGPLVLLFPLMLPRSIFTFKPT